MVAVAVLDGGFEFDVNVQCINVFFRSSRIFDLLRNWKTSFFFQNFCHVSEEFDLIFYNNVINSCKKLGRSRCGCQDIFTSRLQKKTNRPPLNQEAVAYRPLLEHH